MRFRPAGRSVINGEPRRDSNLELLRILSIIAIIGYHFYTQTAIGSADETSVSACTAMFLGAFGRTGVDVFVIIGAWFLIEQRFKSMRLVRLYVPCLCYGLTVTLLIVLAGHTAKGTAFRNLLRAATPFSSSPFWFVTAYLLLLLLSPYLNVFIHTASLQQLRALNRILLVLFVFIPSVENMLPGFAVYRYYLIRSDVYWFIALYLIVGYWKRCPDLWIEQGNRAFVCLAGLILFAAGACLLDFLLTRYLSPGFSVQKLHACRESLFYETASVFCFFTAAAAFFSFRRIHVVSPVVNRISRNILGVYIIHQIPAFYPVMWGWFRTETWVDSPWFVPLELATVLSVFAGAWFCDNLGSLLLTPFLHSRWLDARTKRIDGFVNGH